MSDFNFDNIEQNAHISWIKEAFGLIKRNLFFFIFISCVCYLIFQEKVFEYSFSLFLCAFLSIFSLLLGLKSDNSISFIETLKGFNFEEDGFFKNFFIAWKEEVLLSIVCLILIISTFLFLPNKNIEPEYSMNFFDILISIIISINFIAGSFKSFFHFQFNVFFNQLTNSEFNNLFLDKILNIGKPIFVLIIADLIFGSLLFLTIFTFPTSDYKTLSLVFISSGLFFFKMVQFVAFREIFIGRGKNKEVESKVNERDLTPIPIKQQ